MNGSENLSNGAVLPRKEDVGSYPNYKQIIPDGKKVYFEVAFDAEILHKISKALGAKSGSGIILRFKDPESPILVTKNRPDYEDLDDVAAIMPCRVVPGA